MSLNLKWSDARLVSPDKFGEESTCRNAWDLEWLYGFESYRPPKSRPYSGKALNPLAQQISA